MVCPTASNATDHIYTCDEISMAHGWPTLDLTQNHVRRTLNYSLSDLPLSAQIRMVGDGMTLNVVQAWLLYLFSHTLRRSELEKIAPQLSYSEVKAPSKIDYDNDDTEQGSNASSASAAKSSFDFQVPRSVSALTVVAPDDPILIEDSLPLPPENESE